MHRCYPWMYKITSVCVYNFHVYTIVRENFEAIIYLTISPKDKNENEKGLREVYRYILYLRMTPWLFIKVQIAANVRIFPLFISSPKPGLFKILKRQNYPYLLHFLYFTFYPPPSYTKEKKNHYSMMYILNSNCMRLSKVIQFHN